MRFNAPWKSMVRLLRGRLFGAVRLPCILSKDPLTSSGFSPNRPGFFGETMDGVRQAIFNRYGGALWTQRRRTKTILPGDRFESCLVHCESSHSDSGGPVNHGLRPNKLS